MPDSRVVLRMLAFAETCGVREEIVGDILEEMARGRRCGWICRQLLALCGLACVSHLRDRARVTPQRVAVGLSLVMLMAMSMMPVGRVLAVWLTLYYLSGALSLFAHMAAEGLPDTREDRSNR